MRQITLTIPALALLTTAGMAGSVAADCDIDASGEVNIVSNFFPVLELIDRKVIAGVSYDGEEVTQSFAILTESLMIYQVSGQAEGREEYDYKASDSTARRFQLTPSGKVVEF